MIKIGKLTDYAIVIMGYLIKEDPDSSKSANYISEKTKLPEPTVAKILKKLSKGNLVTSIRGASGGYKLNQPVSDISIADIVTIFEGPIAIVACCSDSFENNCLAVGGACSFRTNWDRVNREIISVFDNIKLVDMLDKPCNVNINPETL